MRLLRTVDPVGVDRRAQKRFKRRVYHSKASYVVLCYLCGFVTVVISAGPKLHLAYRRI